MTGHAILRYLTSDCIYFVDAKSIACLSSQCSGLTWNLNQPGTGFAKFSIVCFVMLIFSMIYSSCKTLPESIIAHLISCSEFRYLKYFEPKCNLFSRSGASVQPSVL